MTTRLTGHRKRFTLLRDFRATRSKAFTYGTIGNLTHDGRQDVETRWNVITFASGVVNGL